MALNTKQTFNLHGSLIVKLYSTIMKLQRVHRAETIVKVMLADNTVNLGAAVETINAAVQAATEAVAADPDATPTPAQVLAAKYDVDGYLLTEDQVPAPMTVDQIIAIRPFINL
jgi:hypothetical protein